MQAVKIGLDVREGRTIPGKDLLRAEALPDGRGAEFALRAVADVAGWGAIETVVRERWQVWAGIAWPFARQDGEYAGAAALFGERFSGDVPDGLALLLRWQVFRRIDADGAEGLADVLDHWRHGLALRRAWFPENERSTAYAVRLRSSPAGRAVAPCALSGMEDAEAEYLLQARVRRGLLLVPEEAATQVLRGGLADPPPLRRAVWAALTARERWERPG